MTTRFTTRQIKGKGRGRFIGFPTINMEVPAAFELADGIYAVWATIEGTKFRGAMHWGPIPTFDDTQKSLEVFLLGVGEHELSHVTITSIVIELVQKIRDVMYFSSVDDLTRQMEKDVLEVRKILKE